MNQIGTLQEECIESKPLEELIRENKIPPLDSVAFGSFLNHNLGISTQEARAIKSELMHNCPILTGVINTYLGRIGLITLPVLYEEIYEDESLETYLQKAIDLSKSLGASCASLVDLIPSATNYGTTISEYAEDKMLVTTGHGATISAMVFNIDKVLHTARRRMESEVVAFLGLGSIGSSTLELMLSVLQHPKKIILCDVFNKYEHLKLTKERLIEHYAFKGEIIIVSPENIEVPKLIYEQANLIIGATNVACILQTSKLRSGTIIVDDSSPHIFDVDSCLKRVGELGDIIVIHGGILSLPEPTTKIVDFRINQFLKKSFGNSTYRYEIMGCVLGSILPLANSLLVPTTGLLSPDVGVAYFEALEQEGVKGSSLQCSGYHYTNENIDKFCEFESR